MDRNSEIVYLFRIGETLRQIAPKYNISFERVRQILVLCGVSADEGGNNIRLFLKARDKINLDNEKKLKTLNAALSRTGLGIEDLKKYIDTYGATWKRGGETPYGRFMEQRANSMGRGVSWKLSFAEWWRFWQESGHWNERGRGKGYCMARYGDSGAYEVGNIYICTVGQNASDSFIVKPKRHRKNAFRREQSA